MLSRSEKLNDAKAGSVIVKMVCAVVLMRFISNTSDDDQSASCSFAVLVKQADTVPKKLGDGKRGEGSGRGDRDKINSNINVAQTNNTLLSNIQ